MKRKTMKLTPLRLYVIATENIDNSDASSKEKEVYVKVLFSICTEMNTLDVERHMFNISD